MPWQEVSVMDQREAFVRLASLEGANRRALCRRFGIHPDTGYKWLRRRAAGETELDHSRRPHRSPNQTEAILEAKAYWRSVTRIRRGARASSPLA